MEDKLQLRRIFDGRRPLIEDGLQLEMPFDGRHNGSAAFCL